MLESHHSEQSTIDQQLFPFYCIQTNIKLKALGTICNRTLFTSKG
jgi:hypothetical protein